MFDEVRVSTFKRFEEIQAWQKARRLAHEVYEISRVGPFAKDYVLRDQMRKAAVSVMSDIAEGLGRAGNKEFGQFLSVAKGSISELESQLYIAFDQKYITQAQFEIIYKLADETGRRIAGLIPYLGHTKFKSTKYK